MASKKMRKGAPKNDMEPNPSAAFPPKKKGKMSTGKPVKKPGKRY
jgi:hypothetical protein